MTRIASLQLNEAMTRIASLQLNEAMTRIASRRNGTILLDPSCRVEFPSKVLGT
jgi:hypothetical protein